MRLSFYNVQVEKASHFSPERAAREVTVKNCCSKIAYTKEGALNDEKVVLRRRYYHHGSRK